MLTGTGAAPAPHELPRSAPGLAILDLLQAVTMKSDKIERSKVVRNFIVPPCCWCEKIALEQCRIFLAI